MFEYNVLSLYFEINMIIFYTYLNYKQGNMAKMGNLFPHHEIHMPTPTNMKQELHGDMGQNFG